MSGPLLSTMMGASVMTAAMAGPAAADDISAKAQVCTLCHGPGGVPAGPAIPVIWGQQENYLVKELHDYRAGDRDNAMMAPVAAHIAQEDTRPMAAYFAAKTWPRSQGQGAGPAP